jgi:ABC-type lipopolysaccharide export system ATPase subunit
MRGCMDERVARLTEVLQLDEAQQSAVKKILEERRQEFWRIRHAPSLSGNERIDRVRALQQITVEQIRGVLNDEQKTKYDPLTVRRLQPAPEQHSVEDWLTATTKP